MIVLLADAGVPMLFVQTPAMIITLPLVILIEGLVCVKLFQVPNKNAFGAAAVANLASTIVGFPVLWIGLFAAQLLCGGGGVPKIPEPWRSIYSVTVQAPWLLPYENKLYWMIPTAMLVLLVPAFFMSVIVERFFYCRILRKAAPSKDCLRLSWQANLYSYAFLALLGFVLLLRDLLTHRFIS